MYDLKKKKYYGSNRFFNMPIEWNTLFLAILQMYRLV